ncbi:MAG TPA: HEAT repeat domain-containing protein [Vicinamibacterales bacterium]|nr:HEAT repeat domain-containing protein [Vicinamibacterales bacterium]
MNRLIVLTFAGLLAAAAPAAGQAPSPAAPDTLAPMPWGGLDPALAEMQKAQAAADAALANVPWQEAGRAALRADQAVARARADEARSRDRDRDAAGRDRENALYSRGQSLLDQGKWDAALEAFQSVATLKGPRADAAMYWTAYAQNRLGQRADALTTIAELRKAFPDSRYQQQAKALEVEVRQNTGRPVSPASENDEDLKLMAIQALQNSDPGQAIPMLQKILEGSSSPKLKARALFVLAQSDSPQARTVLVGIARGSSTPDLQNKAIQYLGVSGSPESRKVLSDVYAGTTDVDVKRRILRAFMVAGEKDRLLSAAQTETNPDLRAEAVRQLGVMGAHDELWTMYQKETSTEVKKQILQAMFVGGDATRLIALARSEKNPDLKRLAVRNLGLLDGARTGDALTELYASDPTPDIRHAVVQALFIQGNATSLVALARKEQDPEMKKDIVRQLSLMHSKVATDYLLELLSK